MTNIKLSIIIPTCNRTDLLSSCIELLTSQIKALDATNFEIIVTDDSSNDFTKKIVEQKFKEVRWISGPKKGPASNRNNGANQATGNWLIFVDDDCLPDKNLLTIYIQALYKYPNLQVFEGCVKTDRKQNRLDEESPVNEKGGFLWSCNFMINKQLFLYVFKGFDEQFPYAAMEDVDLAYRIRKNGNPIIFIENAIVIHPWRVQRHMISITLKRFKSTLYFLKKHPEKKSEINSYYFLRAFYINLFRQTLSNAASFKFRGFFPKVCRDFMQLYFAIYLFLFNDH